MPFLGTKNPYRKNKGFSLMAKTLPYVFSHNFQTRYFQRKYGHLSSFQKVVILSLEAPGSKVMTEKVRPGFHHRPKSLIFRMGFFCTHKNDKIECLETPSGPNGLKFGTHTLRVACNTQAFYREGLYYNIV